MNVNDNIDITSVRVYNEYNKMSKSIYSKMMKIATEVIYSLSFYRMVTNT